MTILLDSSAARTCAVKTQNAYDPDRQRPIRQPSVQEDARFDAAAQFKLDVLNAVRTRFRGTMADLTELADQPQHIAAVACLAAMRDGAEVIIGGRLPADPVGHRTGHPDLLVRGDHRPDGRPGYHPAQVKWHKITEKTRLPRFMPTQGDESTRHTPAPTPVRYTTIEEPQPSGRTSLAGSRLKIAFRKADFLQLAHYTRLIEAAGFGHPMEPLAAVIGTDDLMGEPFLAWLDLSQPVLRTFSRNCEDGWRLRSVLDSYDFEHALRVGLAKRAMGHHTAADGPLPERAEPVVTSECKGCVWWEQCRQDLDAQDLNLRLDKGRLDVREVVALRRLNVRTTTDLAAADLDNLLDSYLPEVTHRSGADQRLRTAARRAQLLASGQLIERQTSGPIELPRAELEIAFDIENAVDDRVYLWGFHLTSPTSPARYQPFARFADLTEAAEADLAIEALGWLKDLVDGPRTVAVYHYSSYEVSALHRLAARHAHPLLVWGAAYADEHFVDLLETVRTHFFAVAGIGLKPMATLAGFTWRDEDPGGLNSQTWFAESVHAENPAERARARQRVLDYNEDDVIATTRVKEWLREQ